MRYTLPFLLTASAHAAGLSKEEFASILSSDADNEMEHMTTQSIEDTWSTASMQAWEVAKNLSESDDVASPFIACSAQGNSGYARKQSLSSVFTKDNGSMLAEFPIYNSSDKTCYHLMARGSVVSDVLESADMLAVEPMSPLMKIRKGTIAAASNAASRSQMNVRISTTFGPGIDSAAAATSIVDKLQGQESSVENQEFIAEAFPYSNFEEFTLESFESPSTLFNSLDVPDDAMESESATFIVTTPVGSRSDLLAVIAGIAAQPEVVSVELMGDIGF